MSTDDYKPDLTQSNAVQPTETDNEEHRLGSQSQNQGGQSQGQTAETDQPYGQDNGTVPKNELGTETENLVADDEIDSADAADSIDRNPGGDDDDDRTMSDTSNSDAGEAEGAVDDRLVDEPNTSERRDDNDILEVDDDELTPEDMSPAAEI